MLVFCRAAWLFFPLFPIYGHHDLLRKLSAFADAPELLALSILALPAQFLIAIRQRVIPDLVSAILGVALFAWRSPIEAVTKIEAWSFAAVIVIRGLPPFQFAAAPAHFTWIPFGGMFEAEGNSPFWR